MVFANKKKALIKKYNRAMKVARHSLSPKEIERVAKYAAQELYSTLVKEYKADILERRSIRAAMKGKKIAGKVINLAGDLSLNSKRFAGEQASQAIRSAAVTLDIDASVLHYIDSIAELGKRKVNKVAGKVTKKTYKAIEDKRRPFIDRFERGTKEFGKDLSAAIVHDTFIGRVARRKKI